MQERPKGIFSRVKRAIHIATGDYASPPLYEPTPDELKETQHIQRLLSQRSKVDLKPVQELLQTPDAFGLHQDTVRTAQKVLRALHSRPSLDPQISGEVLWALQEEEKFAKPDHERILEEQASRRRFLKVVGATMAVLAAGGTGVAGIRALNQSIHDSLYSPEVLERERIKKLEFEATHTLGTTFSSETTRGWRIRHPQTTSAEFQEIDTITINTALDSDLKWRTGDRRLVGYAFEYPGIRIENYQASNGNDQPLLKLLISITEGRYPTNIYGSWIPNSSSANFDNRVIEIQNRATGQQKLIQISRPNTTDKIYVVKFVERVQ